MANLINVKKIGKVNDQVYMPIFCIKVTNGAWYGPAYNQKLPNFKTPIKNLFLAGSNTAGSGINNAAGAGLHVSKYVLKNILDKK